MKKLKILLLMLCSLLIAQAQTALFINEKVGTNTPFILNTIKVITFAAGNITVNLKDASTSTFARTDVKYLNFGMNSTNEIVPINGMQNAELRLYPNPVKDILHIEIANSQSTQIEILGIDGRTVMSNLITNTHSTISVSPLPNGLYLLRSNDGTIISSKKFIKQ